MSRHLANPAMFPRTSMLIAAGLLAICACPSQASTTLEQVRAAATLKCGVIATPEDWNKSDLHGPLAALSTEICKAVSVAALGDKAHVALRVYAGELDAAQGLHAGEVDLAVGLTPGATSAWQFDLQFGPPVFFDGQGFLVRKDAPASGLSDLSGLKICVVEGTENEQVLLARSRAQNVKIIPLPFQEEGEMEDGLAVRHCDAISAYVSRLAQAQTTFPRQIGQDRILPEWLTLSPIAPAYRHADAQWGRIVDWTVHALVQAEASGVTQANVGSWSTSSDPAIQRLIGTDWAVSRALGLEDHFWAQKVIAVVGNYGEIYERTVGAHGPLRLPRGRNALWLQGGLMQPAPWK